MAKGDKMTVTLILLALAGSNLDDGRYTYQKEYVFRTVEECAHFIPLKVEELLQSRPDVLSVQATCLLSKGQDL